MRIILDRQGCTVRTATVFGATVITALYSMILPGILSTGVKWYVLRKDTGKGSNVLSSMVYNQLSTIVIMSIFGLGAMIVSNPTMLLSDYSLPRWVLPAICGVILVCLIVVSLLILNNKTGNIIIKCTICLFKPFPAGLQKKIEHLFGQLALFQTVGYAFHIKITLITIFDTLLGGAVTYLLAAKAANISAPFGVHIWLCAVIYVLGRLPISLANLGIRESLLVSLLAIYGIEKSAALLMSMILFSTFVFMALVGGGYQLSWTKKKTISDNRDI